MSKRTDQFQTIRSEGALLPPDILQAVASEKVDGAAPASYHLPPGTKLNEAVAHSWTVLQKHWKAFAEVRERLPDDDTGTEATNRHWLLPLFEELRYGRLTTTKAPEIDGRTYPIERFWAEVPIHLIGCNLPLDRRTKGARGAATASPHSMMQEFLNRREESLWGFLSNGLTLRILRDNVSLSRQAFVEFDLAAMIEGEVYADFALLWMLCHQSRVEAEKPQDFYLEKWSRLAREQGTRVLSNLRSGVARAIEALGGGFIAHPRNDHLRKRLRSGALDKQEYYRQLLRVVYRLLFLFVAEDRGLLHDPGADPDACALYDTHYSTRRLRELAHQMRGSKHADLWHSLSLVFDALSRPGGCPQLGLPGLGSFLWRRSSTEALLGPAAKEAEPVGEPVLIANDDLLAAVRALAYVEQDKVRRSVDYRNLGSEELGSVYESLLELHPVMNVPARTFELSVAAGHERKTTGSYYTPDSLVQCLLDSALEPVVTERTQGKKAAEAAAAILDLKVCDPATGSGHFLIAAAHRLARHLARARTAETEPTPDDYQHALRDVIGRCIYGVDVNPMAVELCKVSLWMEALEPGKPLSFLDHHIQCGNSLLGATPALLEKGIPDEAFKPIEGDDKKLCAEYKRQNRDERRGQQRFDFDGPARPWDRMGNAAVLLANLDTMDDDSFAAVRDKERRYTDLVRSADYLSGRFLADTWCAAFVWKKANPASVPPTPNSNLPTPPTGFDYPITESILRRIERNPHDCAPWMRREIQRLARQYHFFHWHLAFPQVFSVPSNDEKPQNEQTGWSGGFDVVLGNPPWERVKLQDTEFFAYRDLHIAEQTSAATRRRLIQALATKSPSLFEEYRAAQRAAEAKSHILRNSHLYPLCGRGDVNTYAVFAELATLVVSGRGRTGMVLPSGIATDTTTSDFFWSLICGASLVSVYDFENRLRVLFPSVYYRMRFCLLTTCGYEGRVRAPDVLFLAYQVTDLADKERHFSVTAEDIALLNPDTKSCPMFLSGRDALLTLHLSRAFRVFGANDKHDWQVKYRRVFDMSNDSLLFVLEDSYDEREHVGLYEGRMFRTFDHRAASMEITSANVHRSGVKVEATPEQSLDPGFTVSPRYWVPRAEFASRLGEFSSSRWFIALKDVTSATNLRTVIAALVPFVATGNTSPVLLTHSGAEPAADFLSLLNSYALDFTARKKVSGNHLTLSVLNQLPVPTRSELRAAMCRFGDQWLHTRVLELIYTAWDVEAYALDCEYDGPPFRWDEERRFLMRCELDAAFFHLYLPAEADGQWRPARTDRGAVVDETPEQLAELKRHFPTPRHAVDYVMDTFPIVKRKDEKLHGHYRTKRVILEVYDAMAESIRTGRPYPTLLDPPPGPPTDAEGNFIPMSQWDPHHWPPHIHPPRPADVPLSTPIGGIIPSFPSKRSDELLCVAFLELVKVDPGLPADAYVDALHLLIQPHSCEKLLLDKPSKFRKAVKATSKELVEARTRYFEWQSIQDTMLQNGAVVQQGKCFTAGPNWRSVRQSLKGDLSVIIPFVVRAAKNLRDIQSGTVAGSSEAQAIRMELDSQRATTLHHTH